MKRLLCAVVTVYLFVASIGLGNPTAARADSKVHVSFVFVDPTSGKSLGSGNQVRLQQVNRNDNQNSQTDTNGVVSFDISPVDYILSEWCNRCTSDYSDNFNMGIEYLVQPQPDGSVKLLSATDEPVTKDSAGNFKITYVAHRAIVPAGAEDQWAKLTNLPSVGGFEHMYLMTAGQVLVQTRGGKGFETWWLYKPDASGSYVKGTWTQVAQPPAGYNPQNMNGAVLHSGRFIVVGGEQNTNASGAMEENTNQSYIYDPVSNTWTNVPPPNGGQGDWTGIGAAPFVELPNGKVMVGHNGSSNTRGLDAMLYDETTGVWTETGSNKQSTNQEEGYTLLPNGKVLNLSTESTGWGSPDPRLGYLSEVYDPATGLWSPVANMPVILGHSEIGPALTLPNGKVLAMGATGKNALYDPQSNSWTAVPDFPKLRNGLQEAAADNEATILPNGNVLVVTSVFTCSTQNCNWLSPAHWYEYEVSANRWNLVSDDPAQSAAASIANNIQTLSLPTGQVMVSTMGTIMLYTSKGSGEAAWSPIVDNLSSNAISPGSIFKITGKQLAGLTQGSYWGDEQQNATNYGLVQITNESTHHVFYARASNYSDTSISPNAPSTFDFQIGKEVENGPSKLRVIASGFASQPVSISVSGGKDVQAVISQAGLPPKKKTIQCIKGLKITKVNGIAPKCPVGFKNL